jgi:hypothetical protein
MRAEAAFYPTAPAEDAAGARREADSSELFRTASIDSYWVAAADFLGTRPTVACGAEASSDTQPGMVGSHPNRTWDVDGVWHSHSLFT